MTRHLVITADDLGRDARTSATILDLAARGAVTATTLIAVAPAAAVAARAAVDLGLLPRLHATLTSDRDLPGWRPLGDRPSLVDGTGALPTDPAVIGERGTEADVTAELAAQLRWMRARGVPPGGVDSHAGTLYGLVGRSWLAETLRWCAGEGLAFRLPRDLRLFLGAPPPPEMAARHRDAVALADALGVRIPAAMVTNRRSVAELGSYPALRESMLALLPMLPEGTSELFLHPAERLTGDVGVLRGWEAQLLRDPLWTEGLASAGIITVPDWWSAPWRGVNPPRR